MPAIAVMVEPADWYFLISVSTSAVALGLPVYALKKIPSRRAGDTFVLAMTFFLLAAVSAYLLRISALGRASSVRRPVTTPS